MWIVKVEKSMLKRVTNLITVHLDNLSNYQGFDCYYVFEKYDCDCKMLWLKFELRNKE